MSILSLKLKRIEYLTEHEFVCLFLCVWFDDVTLNERVYWNIFYRRTKTWKGQALNEKKIVKNLQFLEELDYTSNKVVEWP